MQQLKALFEGKKVITSRYLARVIEISDAGWVIEITQPLGMSGAHNTGEILFMSHQTMSGAEMRPADYCIKL